MEIARWFPPLGVGWGTAGLVAAWAIHAAGSAHRRIRPAEAAVVVILAAPLGLGAGLLALALRAESQTPDLVLIASVVFLSAALAGLTRLRVRAHGPVRTRPALTWRSPARLLVGLTAGALATSVAAGASSLVTVPVMFWLVSGAHVATAVVLTLIAGFTVYAATFMLLYYSVDEMVASRDPLVPAAAAIGAVALFVVRALHAKHPASAQRTVDRP